MNKHTDIDDLFATTRHAEPYIDNAGFSTKVLARLPQRAELSFWKETLITLAFTALGCTLAYLFFPSEQLTLLVPSKVVISPMTLLTITGLISLACASAYWVDKTNRL